MAEFFKAADVVGAAVEMEMRGQVVYRRLALAAENPEVKRFFENLAAEEGRHEELFSSMARRLGQTELPAWSTMEEYNGYISALLDSHTLFSPGLSDTLFMNPGNLEDSVRSSMKLEKDSMLFFQEMLHLIPGSEHSHILECIAEERRHLRQLSELLRL
jgi:rubrerythrin